MSVEAPRRNVGAVADLRERRIVNPVASAKDLARLQRAQSTQTMLASHYETLRARRRLM